MLSTIDGPVSPRAVTLRATVSDDHDEPQALADLVSRLETKLPRLRHLDVRGALSFIIGDGLYDALGAYQVELRSLRLSEALCTSQTRVADLARATDSIQHLVLESVLEAFNRAKAELISQQRQRREWLSEARHAGQTTFAQSKQRAGVEDID